MYKIGFYNEKIDNKGLLNDCNIIFNDYDKLKQHIRLNDTIVIPSMLTLFNIDQSDIMNLKAKYNLNVIILDNLNSNNSVNDFGFNIGIGINEYIKNNSTKISKLIKEYDNQD